MSSTVWFILPIVFYKQLIKGLEKRENFKFVDERVYFELDSESVNCPETFLKNSIIFSVLLLIIERGVLFKVIAYPSQLPNWFLIGLTLLGLFLILYACIFILEFKEVAVDFLLQSIFFDQSNHHEIIKIFESILSEEKTYLEEDQITSEIEQFLKMGILSVPKSMKKELFPNSNKVRISINNDYLERFQELKMQHQN